MEFRKLIMLILRIWKKEKLFYGTGGTKHEGIPFLRNAVPHEIYQSLGPYAEYTGRKYL
jgi:hypothetical protein